MFPWNMLPFNKELKGPLQGLKPNEIEKYVQDMMSKMFTQGMQAGVMNTEGKETAETKANSNSSVHKDSNSSHIFETHDFVFAMIPIKQEELLKQLKVYHTSNQLILEHMPALHDKKVFTLPATVKKRGAVATYKDGVLEVKIPKNMDLQYSEIDINEIL